jgi:mRNA interferase HicA
VDGESADPVREIHHGLHVKRDCAFVLRSEYYWTVTASELKRKLAKLGCTFEQGTRHLIVRYQRNRTLMPRHPSQEIQTGTYYAILKKLGIKE